jgi:hypothetical protein
VVRAACDTIILNTGVAFRKVRNLRRDPRASVCVTDLNPARHVTLEGTMTFDEAHGQPTRQVTRYMTRRGSDAAKVARTQTGDHKDTPAHGHLDCARRAVLSRRVDRCPLELNLARATT